MDSLTDTLILLFVLHGVWILGALLVLAAVGIWRLGRGRRFGIPARWPGRIASLFLIVFALVCGSLIWAVLGPMAGIMAEGRAVYAKVGQEAPDLAFRQVSDGAQLRLRDLRGQVVVLNLWATWCPVCREEMPTLDRLQREHGDEGLVAVTVSDEDLATLRKYADEYRPATLYVQNPAITQKLGFRGRPLSLVIDRQGIIREAVIGGRSYEAFARTVKRLL